MFRRRQRRSILHLWPNWRRSTAWRSNWLSCWLLSVLPLDLCVGRHLNHPFDTLCSVACLWYLIDVLSFETWWRWDRSLHNLNFSSSDKNPNKFSKCFYTFRELFSLLKMSDSAVEAAPEVAGVLKPWKPYSKLHQQPSISPQYIRTRRPSIRHFPWTMVTIYKKCSNQKSDHNYQQQVSRSNQNLPKLHLLIPGSSRSR